MGFGILPIFGISYQMIQIYAINSNQNPEFMPGNFGLMGVFTKTTCHLLKFLWKWNSNIYRKKKLIIANCMTAFGDSMDYLQENFNKFFS